MTKDVLLTISGMHYDMTGIPDEDGSEEENGPIEVITPASYYFKNGKHYIVYDEVVEGMPGTIRNKIKITGNDSVEIMKSGASSSHMIFEKNRKNQTYYRTPYGQMLIGVNTKNMEVNVKDNKINVSLDYELDVNHEPLADCRIKMNIMAKNDPDFTVLSS